MSIYSLLLLLTQTLDRCWVVCVCLLSWCVCPPSSLYRCRSLLLYIYTQSAFFNIQKKKQKKKTWDGVCFSSAAPVYIEEATRRLASSAVGNPICRNEKITSLFFFLLLKPGPQGFDRGEGLLDKYCDWIVYHTQRKDRDNGPARSSFPFFLYFLLVNF